MSRVNYTIETETAYHVIIRDVGPWDQYMTVTNGPEIVILELAGMLKGRNLFYYDSEGQLDQIQYDGKQFIRFAPGPHPSGLTLKK